MIPDVKIDNIDPVAIQYACDDGSSAAVYSAKLSRDEATRIAGRFASYHGSPLLISFSGVVSAGESPKRKSHLLVAYVAKTRDWVGMEVPDRLDWRRELNGFLGLRHESLDFAQMRQAPTDAFASSLLILGRRVKLDRRWYGFLETLGSPDADDNSFCLGRDGGFVTVSGYRSFDLAVAKLKRRHYTVLPSDSHSATLSSMNPNGMVSEGFLVSNAHAAVAVVMLDASPKVKQAAPALAAQILDALSRPADANVGRR